MILFCMSVAVAADPPADPPVEAVPEAQSGQALYLEHCAGCHGKKGRATFPGVMMGAGSFASSRFWEGRPDDRLRRTVVEGGEALSLKKAMPAYGEVLDAGAIERVLAFAQSFRP